MKRPYNSENAFAETYGEHKKFLELSFDQFRELKQYCDEVGIMMTASGWDEESVDFLYELGVPFFKVASADLTNFPLLEHTAKKGLPMFISTGMSNIEDVTKAYELISVYNSNICIMNVPLVIPQETKI